MSTLSLGDILEGLRAEELRISPSLAYQTNPYVSSVALAAPGVPSNQQILDATKTFYAKNQRLVDTTTNDTKTGAQKHPNYVRKINSYNWKNHTLTQQEQDTTSSAIGLDDGNGGDHGIWENTLDNVKGEDLISTIGLGVNADLQAFVGGAGGLGCMWDIAKRKGEGPTGYGFATGEIGLRVVMSLNVQCLLLNQVPSTVNVDVYGLKLSIDVGISVAFQVFFMPPGLTLLGYGIGAGVGLGAGATVFGGHVWNFR